MKPMFRWPWRRQGVRAATAVLALAAAWPTLASSATSLMQVALDQASIVRLPERVATIVIGNPLIADVSVQPGGLMVLTGKGYGMTNIVALDRAGNVLMERDVEVVGPQSDKIVVVYRGVNRESYSCAPMCERRITLGDTPEFFQTAISEAESRSSRAQSDQKK